jgi:hypothetical protein
MCQNLSYPNNVRASVVEVSNTTVGIKYQLINLNEEK